MNDDDTDVSSSFPFSNALATLALAGSGGASTGHWHRHVLPGPMVALKRTNLGRLQEVDHGGTTNLVDHSVLAVPNGAGTRFGRFCDAWSVEPVDSKGQAGAKPSSTWPT